MRWLSPFAPKRSLPLLSLAIAALTDYSTPGFHCAVLSGLLPENTFFPGSESYSASISSYYSLQARLNPACIVIPSSAIDLPNAIFALRGGGHPPNVGFANTKHGITIDLSLLSDVRTNDDGSIVSVEPGARWTEVHRAFDPLGLDVVGGKVGTVGVGGLITGGGVSAFSPMRGWACDNVLNMQVGLASGEIIEVNDKNERADLFVALKGGQGNLGIVTRFDLRPFRQSPYWGGLIFHPPSTEETQLAAFAEFRDPANYNPRAGVEHNFMYVSSNDGTGIPFCMNSMLYSEEHANLQLTDFTEELGNNPFPHNRYLIQACTTFRFSPEILPQILAIWSGYRDKIQNARIPDTMLAMTLLDVPALLPTSHNSLGFPPDSKPDRELILCLFSIYWLNDEYSSRMEHHALDHPYRYINYANAANQDPLRGKYDPHRVFQEKVPGGWKFPLDENFGFENS
ncbi:hypothetical protein BJX76DRAFT_348197 [Aspergillus varians]